MQWFNRLLPEQSIMSTGTRMLHALAALGGTTSPSASSANALSGYTIDSSSVSVSGLSAGASFTMQLGIAYSSIFTGGFGVFAGQPFDCARNQSYATNCSNNATPDISIPLSNIRAWSGKQIDPISNLASRKFFFWVGGADNTVGPNVTYQAYQQLLNLSVPGHQISYYLNKSAPHTFPTDFSSVNDSACTTTHSPYVSNCNYDGAGNVLTWLFGKLNPRNDGTPTGQTLSFAQTKGTFGTDGMADTGYLYVPKNCAAGSGTRCRLHVAVHGCRQSYEYVGGSFINGTGYNRYADTNNIIILYPQATYVAGNFSIFDGKTLHDDNACFDWLGIYGTDCDQKSGTQLTAVVNQVKALLGSSY